MITITGNFSFPVDCNHQITATETGRNAEFLAYRREFSVTSGTGRTFYGMWQTLREATAFANSMGHGAAAQSVDSYWYAPAWGRVDEHQRHAA